MKVLKSWKDALPDDYTVKDFITEIQEWDNEDYLDDKAWNRLKQCVSSKVLEGLVNRESLMVLEETPEVELLSKMKAERKGTNKKKT